MRYPQDLLPLPDGDLLLSLEAIDRNGPRAELWRVHPTAAAGPWPSERLWQGRNGARQLMAEADGGAVWFRGTPAEGEPERLFVYRAATRQLQGYTVDGASTAAGTRWELDAAQRPTVFDHGPDPVPRAGFGDSRLAVGAPTGAPPPAGGPWPFATVLRAPRQALMERAAKGNTLLWPVRLRDPQALWIEDGQGLAALDPANGRVQRAFALPQRFGAADPNDASGTAQWVPTPLGSLEGRWIATGFVLMLPEPPDAGAPVFAPGAGASARLSRFVGMHVVDSRDGQVRVSALLGEADSLGAAARSAHGRLLALGADGPSAGAPQVALWPLAGGGEPLRLEAGSPGALTALAFSWDGTTLWALGDRGLLRWTLPAALHDAADAGAYPEHSRD